MLNIFVSRIKNEPQVLSTFQTFFFIQLGEFEDNFTSGNTFNRNASEFEFDFL